MHRSGQWMSCVVVMVAALLGAGGVTSAQEKGAADKPGEKAAAKSSKESPPGKENATKAANGRRRLPRFYGKLGLSEAQREKIYSVQEKHAAEIEKLEKQLADLREKQEAECRKILNPEQKKQLTENLDASKARSKGKDDSDEMEG